MKQEKLELIRAMIDPNAAILPRPGNPNGDCVILMDGKVIYHESQRFGPTGRTDAVGVALLLRHESQRFDTTGGLDPIGEALLLLHADQRFITHPASC